MPSSVITPNKLKFHVFRDERFIDLIYTNLAGNGLRRCIPMAPMPGIITCSIMSFPGKERCLPMIRYIRLPPVTVFWSFPVRSPPIGPMNRTPGSMPGLSLTVCGQRKAFGYPASAAVSLSIPLPTGKPVRSYRIR